MKNLLSILLLSAIILGCNSNENDRPELQQSEVKELTPPKPVEIPNWNYSSTFDKMEGDSTFFATATSSNFAHFDFPYDGGSTLSVTLRDKPNETDVILQISKGQFSSTYKSPNVSVKFDNDEKMVFGLNEPNSGSPDVLFVRSEKKFIDRIKTAKELLIQVDFYNYGSFTFEFDVEGLNWEH